MALTEINFDKLILDKFIRVTGKDITTSELLFIFDQIQDGGISNTEDKNFLTGAAGVNLAALKRNKAATANFNNAYLVMSALGVQTGSGVEVASAENKFTVPVVDLKEVDSTTTATLSKTPKTGTVKFIYKANPDGTQGTKYLLSATAASATEFTITGSTITLPTSAFEAGDRFIAMYDEEATVGKKIINKGDTFSKDCYILIEALCRDICNNNTLYYTKIVLPYASVDGNFNITVGATPEPHAFSAQTLPNPCGINNELWSWYLVA
jgi:hypothetical protein